MELLTWQSIDDELDEIEMDDVAGLLTVFFKYSGVRVAEGRKTRLVTASSFSRHIGVSYYIFNSWLRIARSERTQETA